MPCEGVELVPCICMETLARTLAMLQPDELYPLWRYIDMMEQCGEADTDEAKRWKHGIFGLMLLWGLEPDDVLPPDVRSRDASRRHQGLASFTDDSHPLPPF